MLNTERGRFILIVAIMVIATIAITSVFLFVVGDEKPNDQINTVELSQDEKNNLSLAVNGALKTNSTWGVNEEKLNGDNIFDLKQLLGTSTEADINFYAPKTIVYKNMQESYISSNSPLYYDEKKYDMWQDPVTERSMLGAEFIDAKFDVPSGAKLIAIDDGTYKSVTIPITLETKVTARDKTVDDSSWDGSWRVRSNNFIEEIDVTFILVGDEWQLYKIEGLKNKFLLVTSGDPKNLNTESGLFSLKDAGIIQS